MNRQTFLHRMGLGFLGALFARSASATTEHSPGAPDTADAVPAEPVGVSCVQESTRGSIEAGHTHYYVLHGSVSDGTAWTEYVGHHDTPTIVGR
ncbi:MAG: hypothetical protein ACPGVY_17050 [Mycobacterium sp.]